MKFGSIHHKRVQDLALSFHIQSMFIFGKYQPKTTTLKCVLVQVVVSRPTCTRSEWQPI